MSLQDFQMSYEWSPITLVGGIAQNMNGGALPILYLLQPGAFPGGILTGGLNIDPDQIFAHFQPISGGKLISNEIAEYPLANQIVAANAIIVQPLRFSLVMKCPAQTGGLLSDVIGALSGGSLGGGYASKLATITSLQSALAQHTTSGGTYNVATPSYIYTNCLLLDLVDVSGTETKQVQTEWQWDFEQPLLTLAQAQQAQNNLMSKLSSGTQVAGSDGAVGWTGPSNTVNQPSSLATPSFVPSSTGSNSSAVSGWSGPVL